MHYAACTTEERYLRAICATKLTLDVDTTHDIDQLIAAGLVGAKSRRAGQALAVARWKGGDNAVRDSLTDELAIAMRNEALRGMRKGGHLRCCDAKPFTPASMRSTAAALMAWWRDGRCNLCRGRGHPLLPGCPAVDETRMCFACEGTGTRPLERVVRREHQPVVNWLLAELSAAGDDAYYRMRRLTRDVTPAVS